MLDKELKQRLEKLLSAKRANFETHNKFVMPSDIKDYLNLKVGDKVVFEGWGDYIGLFNAKVHEQYLMSETPESLRRMLNALVEQSRLEHETKPNGAAG
jgi:hypothetical protein